MTKLQSGADLKLIKAGLSLAKEKGLTNFSVRELCKKAGVNPGLFHYYFTSRENFNNAVLKELYNSELLNNFTINISSELSPKEKLIAVRDLIETFTRNNSSLISSVIMDIVSGNRQILAFIEKNFTQHIKIIFSVVEECKKEGLLENADTVTLVLSLVVPLVAPNVMAGILSKILNKNEFAKVKPFAEKVLSEKIVKERARLALKAVLK